MIRQPKKLHSEESFRRAKAVVLACRAVSAGLKRFLSYTVSLVNFLQKYVFNIQPILLSHSEECMVYGRHPCDNILLFVTLLERT